MDLRKTIGNSIYQLRIEKMKTQEEVAKVGGLSRKYLAELEYGAKMVSIDILLKIAKGLEVSLIDLLNGIDYEGIRSYAKSESIIHQKIELKTEGRKSLYYQGDVLLLDSPKRIAIMGTKTPSVVGIRACEYFTRWFMRRDYIIVSGLGKGIETIAHQTCIENNGKTISVLSSGMGNIYPPENMDLARNILKSGGLLLTEYPEFSHPSHKTNEDSKKIEASLGLGVILIEPQFSSATMRSALYMLKHKGHIGCAVTNFKSKTYNNMSGNYKLMKERKEVFELREDNLKEFEKRINPMESSK